MSFLFQKEINGWDSWGSLFCDREAFARLSEVIFEKERVGAPGSLLALTPGTNAVFRVKDYVLKIYAPMESGIGTDDYPIELKAQQSAQKNRVRVPAIIAHGAIQDRYLFQYLIMEYIDGKEAKELLPSFSKAQKIDFAQKLRLLLEKLHKPNGTVLPAIDVIGRAVNNPRLRKLPFCLAEDMKARALSTRMENGVLAHGDITKENVLICPDGSLALIDFADSVFAPPFYELAPVAFDLFQFDRDLIRAFIGNHPMEKWLGSLMDSLSIHDFGADIILEYTRGKQIEVERFHNLDAFKCHILQRTS